jgi:hypothetical protein
MRADPSTLQPRSTAIHYDSHFKFIILSQIGHLKLQTLLIVRTRNEPVPAVEGYPGLCAWQLLVRDIPNVKLISCCFTHRSP